MVVAHTIINGFCGKRCQDTAVCGLILCSRRGFPISVPTSHDSRVFGRPPWDQETPIFNLEFLENEKRRAWLFKHGLPPRAYHIMESYYRWDIKRYYRVSVNNTFFMVQKLRLRYNANDFDLDENGTPSQAIHDMKSQRCRGWSMYVYSKDGDKIYCLLKKRDIHVSHYIPRARTDRANFYNEEDNHRKRVAQLHAIASSSTSAAINFCPGGSSGGCPEAADEEGLCEWRRAEEKSTGYVLPDRVLVEIAKEMPGSVNKLRRMLKSKCPHIERNVDSVVRVIKQSVQNRAAFESAPQSLKQGVPVTVMDNDIEPSTEGKDINHHTADEASPSFKESLGVEKRNTGPIMVAADTNEGRGLGTGLFGSTKVIKAPSDASYEVQVNACSGKMGKAVIKAADSAGVNIVTTSAETGQKVEVCGTVHGPTEREKVLSSMFEKHPELIVGDYTIPSAVNGVPFVMGISSGDRNHSYEKVEEAKIYAVISPQMGKQGLHGLRAEEGKSTCSWVSLGETSNMMRRSKKARKGA